MTMDKKYYISPEMEAYELKLTSMLCASPDPFNDPDKPQILDGEGGTDDLG